MRLGLLYTVVFVEIGIAMPFMPVWLKALGLDARIIGALLALPIAMKIIATAPLVGLIDRGVAARTAELEQIARASQLVRSAPLELYAPAAEAHGDGLGLRGPGWQTRRGFFDDLGRS